MMKTALFLRLDRMGDLVLTLPCDQMVPSDYQVLWAIPRGLDFVLEHSQPSRSFFSMESKGSLKNFWQFYKKLKALSPHVSLSFHVPWWVNLALFMAGVPQRGGVLSQWHSYLFLNRGLRQKRSQCLSHEMDYNLELTKHCMALDIQPKQISPLKLTAPQDKKLDQLPAHYFVVHPGMGGSALNWSTDNYKKLIQGLTERAPVVITGTAADEPYLTPLKQRLTQNNQVIWLDGQLSGGQLLSVLKNANAIIAPSTGVLHLGASLGATSLGIYSPIKVHHPDRWGPKGEKAKSFLPQVDCPAHFDCIGPQCGFYNCMDKMPVEPILNEALTTFADT
jgi:ADP-heptose:LPS heptosyltransferase